MSLGCYVTEVLHANNIDDLVNCSILVGQLRIQMSTFTGCVVISVSLLINYIAILIGLDINPFTADPVKALHFAILV